MNQKKSSISSTYLLFFLGIILLLAIINNILINNSISKFSKYNSILINNLTNLRSDIQRYVKLKIYGKSDNMLKENIDELFNHIAYYTTTSQSMIPNKFIISFFDLYNSSQNFWDNIKATKNKDELISLSEKTYTTLSALTNLLIQISNFRFNNLKKTILIFTLITTAIILILFFLILYYVKSGLEKNTITDPLTKLYNRLHFDLQYSYLINKYKRNKTSFSAFLFDIDNFKKINDKYGHPVGDEVLIKISKIIKKSIRKVDMPFRYGGEEFIILFPDTDLEKAIFIAERIRRSISENILLENKPVTISGGIGEYSEKYDKYQFLNEIDQALYISKKTGKNRITPII